MRRLALVAAATIAFGAAACEGSSATCPLTGTGRVFGNCCTDDAECASNVCFLFGDGSQLCTLHCTTSEECPEGSQGKKCNRQGVCRP